MQFCIDEFGSIRVNGIDYGGDEYWRRKYPGKSERPTIVEKLGHDKVWWTKFTMEFKMKTRGGGSSGLVLSAAPEQWLEKFMRLCVIIIKQVSRGTAGEENGVRRARNEEPGRGVESEECRGGGRAVAAATTVASCSARVGKLA